MRAACKCISSTVGLEATTTIIFVFAFVGSLGSKAAQNTTPAQTAALAICERLPCVAARRRVAVTALIYLFNILKLYHLHVSACVRLMSAQQKTSESQVCARVRLKIRMCVYVCGTCFKHLVRASASRARSFSI